MSPFKLTAYREKLVKEFDGWCDEVRFIKGVEKIIKYGLHDRGSLEPEKWVSKGGRCVLVGDAAHPTSPHLGQGANQALEDYWWLTELLPEREECELGSEELRGVFEKFAAIRQSRTVELVKGAGVQGERRVVGGGEKGVKRDEILREAWCWFSYTGFTSDT
jgi:salicylate hydroxylase